MTPALSTTRAATLYIGALLGPGLLLLPGLADRLAGPASVLAWVGLLLLSGLFAVVFTGFGTRLASRGGAAAYSAAGLGPVAGRAVGWCFLTGVVVGAPAVCLIGAGYVGSALGAGRTVTLLIAGLLLAVIVAVTLAGARVSGSVQLGLIGVLIVLVVIAVVGSAPHARAANWTPFAPHGWPAVGSAAAVLLFSFVGWEAIAPLTGRMADPQRQLPRVIGIAFAATAIVYLSLAVATVSVLGSRAGGAVPVADLLRVAIGPAGRVLAAAAAVSLTVAAVNAYVSGAVELAADLRRTTSRTGGASVQAAVGIVGVLVLTGAGLGRLSTTELVAIPTAMFLTVYLGCLLAAIRRLPGVYRAAAVAAVPAVAVLLGFSGWAVAGPCAVVGIVVSDEIRRRYARQTRNPLLKPQTALSNVCATPLGTDCGASA